MGDSGWGCLGKTALGCGAAVLLGIGAIVVLTFAVMRPFDAAVDDREVLDARFGSRSDWTPSPDGSIAPERMQAFLAVRRAVEPLCDEFTATEAQIMSMQRFDHQEEVSRSEVLREALATTRRAIGLGPLIGELYAARNAALVETGMGLGEYVWIYTVAYHDRLGETPDPESTLFGDSRTDRRVLADLRGMLERQLELVNDPVARATLESEVEAMRSNAERLPWADGLPPPVADSVAPFRDRLDELYCQAAAPMELLTNTRRGLAIESE
jgi:hypothetical protein